MKGDLVIMNVEGKQQLKAAISCIEAGEDTLIILQHKTGFARYRFNYIGNKLIRKEVAERIENICAKICQTPAEVFE